MTATMTVTDSIGRTTTRMVSPQKKGALAAPFFFAPSTVRNRHHTDPV
jgi:hypothetical protein